MQYPDKNKKLKVLGVFYFSQGLYSTCLNILLYTGFLGDFLTRCKYDWSLVTVGVERHFMSLNHCRLEERCVPTHISYNDLAITSYQDITCSSVQSGGVLLQEELY